MTWRFRSGVVVALWALLAGCAPTATERLGLGPLEVVKQLDITRYTGTWYEIAAFPQRFQQNCTATTATYTLRQDGELDVLNRCRKGSFFGPVDDAEGRARVVNAGEPAKLEVSFFRPFWGDYWVIELGPDYRYAVVGHPSRDYLWILSRSPGMAPETYKGILERLATRGYELERLVKTRHPQSL